MSVALPQPIADYFAADADKANRGRVAACFTDDAVVKDEGHTYTGRAAIQRWKESSSTKYTYTSTPIACVEHDGTTIVTSHLVGDFPGSPLDLRYRFVLAGAQIAALAIAP